MRGKIFSGEGLVPYRMNAISEMKKRIKVGDKVKFLPNANTPAYVTEAYRNKEITGKVVGRYPFHIVLDKGKWRESLTWAELIAAAAGVVVNGERVIL